MVSVMKITDTTKVEVYSDSSMKNLIETIKLQ